MQDISYKPFLKPLNFTTLYSFHTMCIMNEQKLRLEHRPDILNIWIK